MQDFIAQVTPALVALAVATVTALAGVATRWIHNHTSNATVNGIVDRASHDLAAFAAEQVATMENSPDGMAKAKQATIDAFKKAWGKEGLAELAKVVGIDPALLDAWLGAHATLANPNLSK